jgi:hypothetical protein
LSDVPSRVSWRALKSMVRYSSVESAVFRDTYGEKASVGVGDHLLAEVVYMLRVLAWQPTEDAKKNRNKPKRIVLPGASANEKGITEAEVDESGAVVGSGSFHSAAPAVTIDELKAQWASRSVDE